MDAKRIDSLVGKFFHTTKQCPCGGRSRVAILQGRILAAPSETHLLVEYFEWLNGYPNGQELMALDEFISKEPMLYDSADDMIFSYDHGALCHHRVCDRWWQETKLAKDQAAEAI